MNPFNNRFVPYSAHLINLPLVFSKCIYLERISSPRYFLPLDEPDVRVVLNDKENKWISTTAPLKSTLKRDVKKGAKRKEHVSFEMNKIEHVRNSVLMYGG